MLCTRISALETAAADKYSALKKCKISIKSIKNRSFFPVCYLFLKYFCSVVSVKYSNSMYGYKI